MMAASKASDDDTINILLLGETGVGKSTFINSFVNYLQHTTLEKARRSELISLIPSKFTIPDENFKDRIVHFGSDRDEDDKIGNSSTQVTKSYVFNYDKGSIRLIDTPGIGDARGIEQDGINFENILANISQHKNLHAICFLLKPNVAVLNAYFKFCIMHLVSRLEKSAADNIVFIFTNCRSTFYRPGDTLPVLRRVLEEIKTAQPSVTIPCDKSNIFCVDNEVFKFLVALKEGIPFGDYEMKEFSNSWERSFKTCQEFISYVREGAIKPHPVQNTMSVNEARRNIINLSKPLAEVCDLIQDNITVLNRHKESMNQDHLSKDDLLSKLYVPVVTLNEIKLDQPVTVCSATKCSEIYKIEGMMKYHYKQRCHNPCYLSNVPPEIVGTPELIRCAAMSGNKCKLCGCDFTAHMHIYYETRTASAKQEDVNVKRHIKTKDDAITAKNVLVGQLQRVSREYEHEKEEISKCMAKFAHFLKTNSIAVYNDAYLDYLNYLIEREKLLGSRKDQERINRYVSLKKQYDLEKQILEDSMKSLGKTDKNAAIILPSTVLNLVKDLYKLPHTGKKIKALHQLQQKSVQNSVRRTEYRHTTAMSSSANTTDASSDDDDEERISDIAIISSLMEEDNLEQMRLKLLNMKLSGDRAKVDNRKQKIFEYVSDLYSKAGGNDGGQKTNRGRGGRGNQQRNTQNVHKSYVPNRYANSMQRTDNQTQFQHQSNLPHESANNRPVFPPGYLNNRGGYNPNRGGYNTNRGGYNTNRGGYNTNRGGFNTNRGGYNRGGHNAGGSGKFKKPNKKTKNQNVCDTSGNSSDSNDDNNDDTTTKGAFENFNLMKFLEEKDKKSGVSTFVYYSNSGESCSGKI